jgi:hypothetical protein
LGSIYVVPRLNISNRLTGNIGEEISAEVSQLPDTSLGNSVGVERGCGDGRKRNV